MTVTTRSALALALAVAAAYTVATAAPPPAVDTLSFLELAGPLMTAEERSIYLALGRDYRRTAFEKRFWASRDPFPETPVNELEVRWRERVPAVLARFGSLADPRAFVQLLAGEPATRATLGCPGRLRPGEIWIFDSADRIREPFALVFLDDPTGAAPTLWRPAEGGDALAAPGVSFAAESRPADWARGCPRDADLSASLALAADWDELVRRHGVLPRPDPSWARDFLLEPDEAPPAKPLTASLDYDFPGATGRRTLVEGTFAVFPRAEGELAYRLEGEVVQGDTLVETFRYRFDPLRTPGEGAPPIPVRFQRALLPGSYRLAVRLTDMTTEAELRDERTVDVPFARAPDGGAQDETAAPANGETSVRLRAPLDRLVTGRQRISAELRGEGAQRIAFRLDGRPVFAKTRPPFEVELDFGKAPRPHRVEAIALDARGREVARDEVTVNGGPHRFSLRLVEPAVVPSGTDRIPVRAVIEAPEGERVERVELFLGERLAATIFQPPWSLTLQAPAAERPDWVRAVAYLDGGGAAEDVRLLDGGVPGEALDVDLVEIYASVLDRRGRPIDDLSADEVRVREDGVEMKIRRFERVEGRPIHAGVMIDVSSSMAEELWEAERAAYVFFERVLTPRDRAAVVIFSDEVRLAARFTGRLDVLAGGLADLEARGDTHLHDAVAFTLHYFSGIRGQRAIVLLSDGFDSGSELSFEDTLDYARRTGVAIYAIGLGVPTNPPDGRLALDQLARETGGRSFYVERAHELERVYSAIERELRAQYLIAYQSPRSDGDAFREIDVEILRPGAETRTIRGYYP